MNTLTLSETPGRTAYVNGQEYLFFSGYAYLGMHYVPEFLALVKEGINKYGWLFPSSRVSNTRLALYEECEALLSSIAQAEDTVLVSSGFIAGKLATALWHKEVFNLDPSHPAIQANNNRASENESHVLAIDSVNVLTANITDFSFVNNNEQKIIIIDDSHGIGLIGRDGEGICNALITNKNTSYVLTYSLSKAWNITGGAISCSKSIADMLRTQPHYTACTPPPPSALYAFAKGQHLYRMQRERLKNNISYFQSLIKGLDEIHFNCGLPIFILPETIDEQKLFAKHIIISSFSYPDPKGKKIQRVVLNALHTKNDLEILADNLRKVT
jgi:7-keto-8-aminopelargonate synthetase-like enzyme